MSELRNILTSRQLVKHHEVIQFLTQTPNVKRTLAELDYLLPSGASLQRFPSDWVELMRAGHSGGRNIEVLLPGEDEEEHNGEEEDRHASPRHRSFERRQEGLGFGGASLDPDIALLCRQPVIHSLAELATLLESPATVTDTEGCAALHTTQVKLPESLLREVQRRGLAFYFSEALQAKAATSMAKSGGTSSSSATMSSSNGLSSEKSDAMLNAALTGGMGVPSLVVRLPPGLRLRYKLLTQRGIMVADEHCMPVRLHLGERLQLTIDDESAARHACLMRGSTTSPRNTSTNPSSTPAIHVAFGFVSSVVKMQKEVEENPPLRIHIKYASSSASVTGKEGAVYHITRAQISMEAVRAESFRLILRVRSRHRLAPDADSEDDRTETFMDFHIRGVDVRQPGSLIGREREPTSFTLPAEYTLLDPAVAGGGVDPLEESASARAARILPWWQSGSPSCSLVRDATFPLEEAIQAAAAQVFTRKAVRHESKLRAAKKLLKRQQEEQAASAARDRGNKYTFRANQNLRNRHLIHFGLDASVPFIIRKK